MGMPMINVEIVYANPQRQVEIPLSIEKNTTIAIAIKRSGILSQFPEINLADIKVGIHGKKAALDDILLEGDRIEIYRPLLIDPKQARLLRAKKKD